MYVKVNEDGTTKFPYTESDFRSGNPKTSFPAEIPDSILNSFGVYAVEQSEIPEFDSLTHELSWELKKISSSRWKKQWIANPLPEDEAATRVKDIRNHLLAQTDWSGMSDVVMSDEMRSYRQALRDITKQEGFPYSISWPEKPA